MQILRIGRRGAAVETWQSFLVGQGFDPGPVDGIFGPGTRDATEDFQQTHGLVPDGIVGPRTLGQALLLGFDLIDGDEAEDRSAIAEPSDERTSANWPERPDFPPLVGTGGRQRVFGRFEFVHDPQPDNREHIAILGGWERDNIVTVEIPQLARIGRPRSTRQRFHRRAAEPVRRLWEAWERAGLLDRIGTWHGSYVPRFIRGSTRTLSNHAFGSAFDINYAHNRLGMMPALVGRRGSVRELVPIAHEHGFYWGGHFRRRDGMHFELARLD